MKEHVQKTGVRKYAGDDLIELQAEPLKALQKFFEPYGMCVVEGCKVTPAGNLHTVAPGMVALSGKDAEGGDTFKVVPFAGAENVALPIYLTLSHTVRERAYGDGKVKPVAYDYVATATGVQPAAGIPFLEIAATGGRQFVDAIKVTEKLDKIGNGKDVTVTFSEASTRENVGSGERLSVLFGKVRKWFASLGNLAFKNTATIAEVDHLQATLDTKAQLDASGKMVTSQLPLGETASTAYRGDRGKVAYDYAVGTRTIDKISGLQRVLDGKLSNQNGTILDNSNSEETFFRFISGDNNGYVGTCNIFTYIFQNGYYLKLFADGVLRIGTKINDTTGNILWHEGNFNPNNKLSLIEFVEDANTVSQSGVGRTNAGTANIPEGGLGGFLVNYKWDDNAAHQMFFSYNSHRCFIRTKVGASQFSDWKKIAQMDDIPTSLPASDVSAWAKSSSKPNYEFNEIGSFNLGALELNSPQRMRLFYSRNVYGYQSWVAIGANRRGNNWGRGLFSVGTDDTGTTFTDFEFDVNGRIYSPAGIFALTSEIPTSLPANGGNADTLDNMHASAFATAVHTHNYEPAFAKNSAFNKNFGTSAGTVAQGNHTHSRVTIMKAMYEFTWNGTNLEKFYIKGDNIISQISGNNGKYTIWHNLGHKDYVVILGVGKRQGGDVIVKAGLTGQENGYFTVQTSIGDQFADGGFTATILTY